MLRRKRLANILSSSMPQLKWRGDVLSSLPGLHDTIPSGKNTGSPARSQGREHGTQPLSASQGGQVGNTTTKYAPHALADTGKKPIGPGIPRGPRTAEGCGNMAEFLAQAPWEEQRHWLLATQSELEKHLNSHNFICRRLTVMLENLPTEAIPMAESKILHQMHRILQHIMLLSWPQEWLRLDTHTTGFDDIISEIAQFESQCLGFLLTLKITLLGIYDRLSSTRTIETAEPQPHLAPFLEMRPPLT